MRRFASVSTCKSPYFDNREAEKMSNENEQKEEWKVCEDCDTYAVSNLGRLKRIKPAAGTHAGRFISIRIGTGGYSQVILSKSGKQIYRTVHTLVAKAFLGRRSRGYQVNHKDGNKQNNCVYNLEYCTPKENQRHAIKNGLFPIGERHGNSKLTESDVLQIKKLFEAEKSNRRIGKMFGVGHNCIYSIRLGNTWSWLK